MVPFSLCFRSLTSPVPRSFHSGRSFSEANRNSFARLQEKPPSESTDVHTEEQDIRLRGEDTCFLRTEQVAASAGSTRPFVIFALQELSVKTLLGEQDGPANSQFSLHKKKDFYSHSFFQQRGPQQSSPPEHAGHACHHWGLPGSRRASLEPTEAEAPALTGQPFGQPQDGPCAALASKPEWAQATRP